MFNIKAINEHEYEVFVNNIMRKMVLKCLQIFANKYLRAYLLYVIDADLDATIEVR